MTDEPMIQIPEKVARQWATNPASLSLTNDLCDAIEAALPKRVEWREVATGVNVAEVDGRVAVWFTEYPGRLPVRCLDGKDWYLPRLTVEQAEHWLRTRGDVRMSALKSFTPERIAELRAFYLNDPHEQTVEGMLDAIEEAQAEIARLRALVRAAHHKNDAPKFASIIGIAPELATTPPGHQQGCMAAHLGRSCDCATPKDAS